jgi:hypothetical protein
MKRILTAQEAMEAILRRDPNSSFDEEDIKALESALIAQDAKSKREILNGLRTSNNCSHRREEFCGACFPDPKKFVKQIPCFICGQDGEADIQNCRFCGQSVCKDCYHNELVTKDDPSPICNDCWEAGGDLAKELADTKAREKEAWKIWASKVKK